MNGRSAFTKNITFKNDNGKIILEIDGEEYDCISNIEDVGDAKHVILVKVIPPLLTGYIGPIKREANQVFIFQGTSGFFFAQPVIRKDYASLERNGLVSKLRDVPLIEI